MKEGRREEPQLVRRNDNNNNATILQDVPKVPYRFYLYCLTLYVYPYRTFGTPCIPTTRTAGEAANSKRAFLVLMVDRGRVFRLTQFGGEDRTAGTGCPPPGV